MDVSSVLGDAAESRKMFVAVLESTPDEMLSWHPKSASGDPTSILEIARHCIAAESMFQKIIRDGGMAAPASGNTDWLSSKAFGTRGPAAEAHDRAQLTRHIADAARATEEIVQALPAEAWDEVIETPFMTAPRVRFIRILCVHWSYHCGQAAYVQRLYGDLSLA